MKTWKSKLAVLTLVLALLVSSIQILEASAETGDLPRIEVYRLLFTPTTIDVYVYPDDLDVKTGDTFTCPYRDKVIPAFYETLRRLRKSLIRFADEYPKYEAIVDIRFVNATRIEEADLVLKIVRGWNVSRTLLYRVVDREKPNEIHITCEDAEMFSEPELRGVLMHELLHALGVGHAETAWTDFHEPEVMLNIRPDAYPTTLDLYAVYLVYFNPPDFGDNYKANITLPPDLEYKMVVPYDVEIQRLREENEKLKSEIDDLWSHLRNASDIIEYLNDENRKLRQENEDLQVMNAALEEQVADLWGKLQTAELVIDRLHEENEILKANLTWCLLKGLELGEKCNQTIRRLVKQYNDLNANYSLCREYLAKYYSDAERSKKWVWIMTAAGMIGVAVVGAIGLKEIKKTGKTIRTSQQWLESSQPRPLREGVAHHLSAKTKLFTGV